MGRSSVQWLKAPFEPQETDAALRTFPADVTHLMPAPSAIPSRFQRSNNPWRKFQHQWFFNGLPGNAAFHAKDGIDGEKAYHHLDCIQRSYLPSHQDKERAVAFLASLWFEKVTGEGILFQEVGDE